MSSSLVSKAKSSASRSKQEDAPVKLNQGKPDVDQTFQVHRVAQAEKLSRKDGNRYIKRTVMEFEHQHWGNAAPGALQQLQLISNAQCWLTSKQFRSLCVRLNCDDPLSISAMCAIGDKISEADAHVDSCASFALLYVVTMLDEAAFRSFLEWGRSVDVMGVEELRKGIVSELMEGRRPFG